MAQFTVIIPVFQTPGILRLFLDSLRQTLTHNTDIYFINDGSGAMIQNMLEDFRRTVPQVVILQNQTSRGAAAAINRALGQAGGQSDYTVLLDSDTILCGDWQQKLENSFPDGNIGAIGGVLIYPQTGGIQCCGLTYCGTTGRHLYLNAAPDMLPFCKPFAVQSTVFAFCCIRTSITEELGPLDESFVNGYEDLDYQFRLRKLGYQVLTNPAIQLYHWEKSSGTHRAFNRKSNLGRFWLKHGSYVNSDLTTFLQARLDKLLCRSGPYCGIDFCEGRSEATAVKQWIDEESRLSVYGWEDCSFFQSGGQIWLPECLDSGCVQSHRPFLFLCDQIVQMLNNQYWWSLRRTFQADDLVVDLYGNAIYFSQLQPGFWPGAKIR